MITAEVIRDLLGNAQSQVDLAVAGASGPDKDRLLSIRSQIIQAHDLAAQESSAALPVTERINQLLAQLKSVSGIVRAASPNSPVLRLGDDSTTESLFLRVDGTAVQGEGFSDYQVAKWIADLKGTRLWAGLLTGAPSSAQDVLTLEVDGTVYRRPELSLRQANPRLLVTDTVTQFVGIPEQTTGYALAILDSPYNGNLVAYCPLPAPRDFPLGGQYVIPAGELFLGFR